MHRTIIVVAHHAVRLRGRTMAALRSPDVRGGRCAARMRRVCRGTLATRVSLHSASATHAAAAVTTADAG